MSLFLTPPLFFSLKPQTNLLSLSSNLQTQNFIYFNRNQNPNKPNKISDAELASDFAAEVHRLNTQSKERENAMNMSKQLLFSDLCNYLNMHSQDVKNKWKGLTPNEKLGLVKDFICDWGLNFHPLSPRSVKDLVEEFVVKDSQESTSEGEGQSSDLYEKNDEITGSHAVILPTLKKLIRGFSFGD